MITSTPGLVLLVAEGDAAIDDQPLAAIAVEVEVHPDLARPAERQEEQRVGIAVVESDARCAARRVHRLLLRS